jgi:putative transposase
VIEETMARRPRLEFEGAFYHVLTPGNRKQEIFRDKLDYSKYLRILADYKSRYPFLLYGYVLMPNHVHLLIETGAIPLSKILQGINQRYTMYFNWRYETVGHLFQGRYKAILCDKEEYLLNLIKYIHQNPVRAGLVEEAGEYPWSSHRALLKPKENAIVDARLTLGVFADDLEKAVKLYRVFMGQGGLPKEELEKTFDQRILGGNEFVERILDSEKERILPMTRKHEFGLDEIARGVHDVFGISERELLRKGRNLREGQARSLFCLMAKEYGYKGMEIGEYLQRDPGAVSKYQRHGEIRPEELERVREALNKMLISRFKPDPKIAGNNEEKPGATGRKVQ